MPTNKTASNKTTPKNINIRLATVDDVSAMMLVIKDAFVLSCPSDTKEITISDYLRDTLNAAQLTSLIDNDTAYIFVAEINDNTNAIDSKEIIGLGAIEGINHSTAEFCKLYLHRDYHGYGVGRQLSEVMVTQARQAGFSQLELYVYSGNEKAKILYKKMGFVFAQNEKFHIGDEIHDDEKYILSL